MSPHSDTPQPRFGPSQLRINVNNYGGDVPHLPASHWEELRENCPELYHGIVDSIEEETQAELAIVKEAAEREWNNEKEDINNGRRLVWTTLFFFILACFISLALAVLAAFRGWSEWVVGIFVVAALGFATLPLWLTGHVSSARIDAKKWQIAMDRDLESVAARARTKRPDIEDKPSNRIAHDKRGD